MADSQTKASLRRVSIPFQRHGLWMVMDGYGWLWMVMDGYGWLWVMHPSSFWLSSAACHKISIEFNRYQTAFRISLKFTRASQLLADFRSAYGCRVGHWKSTIHHPTRNRSARSAWQWRHPQSWPAITINGLYKQCWNGRLLTVYLCLSMFIIGSTLLPCTKKSTMPHDTFLWGLMNLLPMVITMEHIGLGFFGRAYPTQVEVSPVTSALWNTLHSPNLRHTPTWLWESPLTNISHCAQGTQEADQHWRDWIAVRVHASSCCSKSCWHINTKWVDPNQNHWLCRVCTCPLSPNNSGIPQYQPTHRLTNKYISYVPTWPAGCWKRRWTLNPWRTSIEKCYGPLRPWWSSVNRCHIWSWQTIRAKPVSKGPSPKLAICPICPSWDSCLSDHFGKTPQIHTNPTLSDHFPHLTIFNIYIKV